MNFMDAHKAVSSLEGGVCLPFLLAMSGSAIQIDLFLKAHAAKKECIAEPTYLPFDTLQQNLFTISKVDEPEIWLLFPWDLAPEYNWRSGAPETLSPVDVLVKNAESILKKITQRPNVQLLYVSALIPPWTVSSGVNDKIETIFNELVVRNGATILAGEDFSLTTYLANGCPFNGRSLSRIASLIIDLVTPRNQLRGKVLVTDLDNTLWAGLISEDGLSNIHAEPSGRGFPHFIYQSLLKRLKSQGVLLAVVSRNDASLVLETLNSTSMVLGTEDFVAVKAGYSAKSEYISSLAVELNLSLDTFVFVDDNPVELTEVSSFLPDVNCLLFPGDTEDLPAFLDEVALFFHREIITAEDKNRTEMYRLRTLQVQECETGSNAMNKFLRELNMEMTIRERGIDDYDRAWQLINKTNQFNLNGRRLERESLDRILDTGGVIYTATLDDKYGNHGEILVCVIQQDGQVISWVLSCRVFQRHVEHAFLIWLAQSWQGAALTFKFSSTEQNEPIRIFLDNDCFENKAEGTLFDFERFISHHENDIVSIKITDETKMKASTSTND